ncbi:MAG: winged helix-turn-helix domain-containing protein [Candidatus Woesearchaeota archaeon]
MAKRTFSEIREILLLTLYKGKQTINTLAKEAGVNWKTTENHLTYLIGKGLVYEVFSSPYARIFELTDKGKEVVEKMKPEGALKFVKKEKGGILIL